MEAAFEEAQHLGATQFSIEHGRTFIVGAVNLENVFGQIQPDGANLLHGTVPPLWRSSNDHVLALDAVGAGRSTSSHPVAALTRLHHYPAFDGHGLRRTGPNSRSALKAKRIPGPFTWIRQG